MLITGFNLASTNYRRTRHDRLLSIWAVAVLGLLLVGLLAVWAAGRGEQKALAQRLARMEGELRKHREEVRNVLAGVPDGAMKRYEARVKVYNQILEASAFSWMGLLVELERSVPPAVSLSEIQPDLASGGVSLRGTARSFEDLTLLMRGLLERTAFRDVYLLRQSERKDQTGNSGGLDFTVSLVYHGGEK